MALSYKARRRWSLAILVVGLPLYIALAWGILGRLDRPPFIVELLIYVILGVLWAIPFRFVFRGVGKAPPDPETSSETKEAGNSKSGGSK